MKDIAWDFSNNDLSIDNGDFSLLHDTSLQNAALITLKEVASIFNPQIGVGFERYYANAQKNTILKWINEAKKQITNDGARAINISFDNNFGNFTINIESKY